ncbi:carotenoid oxygenase [Paecilomyces variotii]|uniref:Carotenoid oxygenase n=1 Tax=Byssochlamys spectabilis TaxID=264951 RepID=A0A443HWQ8_BYSSP|nr:carotenoid oxygenase [Paecilomyces variotii]RWQ96266.1 carotenoid oxygenase [Paecilomyces variotii]
MAGHMLTRGPKAFEEVPQLSGFMKPCRYEGEVRNLEVIGQIPKEINGTFYRVMPDPQFPSRFSNDPWFNGDGNVSAFRFEDGSIHFKQRYVRTEKFLREREAGKALGGKYRNKYTDAVAFTVRTTANTNIFYFNGKLLAIKEDAPPYSMDPKTLETEGLYDFNGQLPCTTFTAHPKIDPTTNELVCFGYEAKGDGTPDVCYMSVSPDGQFNETVWMVAPVVAMIHDFAVTENWVLFPLIPHTCDVERMKNGGDHWQWDPTIPFYIGVLPRRGAKGTDVKWFRAPNSFPGHTANAYEDESGNLIFDLPCSRQNVFWWWPDAEGNAPNPMDIRDPMVRFTIDPRSDNLDITSEVIANVDCEFPRIDDRWATKDYTYCFVLTMDAKLTDFAAISPQMGGGFPPYNGIAKLNVKSGQMVSYFAGSKRLFQEPIFIPRSDSAPEGDGYVVMLVNNYETMASELHILDTNNFEKAVAIVNLPLRLRHGLHGNWVAKQELDLVV